MKLALFTLAAAAAVVVSAPAFAGYNPGHGNNPPYGGGGYNPPPSNPPHGDPTPVPEPTDAVLLLMGVSGVVIGRKLHARAQKKA